MNNPTRFPAPGRSYDDQIKELDKRVKKLEASNKKLAETFEFIEKLIVTEALRNKRKKAK